MASIEVTECIESVRKLIANNIRERVVGPDSSTKAQDLMTAPGPRWFTPDRPIYRVHGDASMFIGGLRAVLFQSLHPLAMAGVAIHSDYKADPWGRLQRTADFLASTSFGNAEVAQAAVNRVLAVHERVTGVASDGRPYSANDPHLLLWVHVAEVDSFLAA
ncbi:MAG: oxygenase MpaB family protein, partial [bacterium]